MRIIKDQLKNEDFFMNKQHFEFTDYLYHGKETEIVEKFNCLICLKIIKDPFKCANCSKLYCQTCIEKALINSNRCPHCRCSPFNKHQIDLNLKDILDQLEFKCPLECNQIIRYSQQEKHKEECLNIEQFNKCNLCKILVEKNNKDAHLKECEYLILRCVFCDETLNIMDI